MQPVGPVRPLQWLGVALEWVCVAGALVVGAWLRFGRLDLLEFKGDEALALHLAAKLAHGSGPVWAGLMSSVKVTNPPLFIYLLAPLVWIESDPAFISCCIAALNLGAVALCWHIGRKYYGRLAGAVAALLFAVSPWAVIYSRKIWAQDLVPVFATGALWALHVLVLDRRPKAIFWVLLLPLCLIQIHFSGLALTAMILALLWLLRPQVDWPRVKAAVAVAALLLIPYLWFQVQTGGADFRQALATLGGQQYRIPDDLRVDPRLGYAYPRRDSWVHAVAIVNAGEIEDILGLSARWVLDPQRVWPATCPRAQYFRETQGLENPLLWLEQIALVAAWGWLAVRAARGLRVARRKPFASVPADAPVQTALILTLWIAVPVAVFVAARLWTYLSYFVILLPAEFLALGIGVQELLAKVKKQPKVPGLVVTLVAAVAVANVVFLTDLNNFLDRYGGAHGAYGTTLANKQAAADRLAERVDVAALMRDKRLWQMDRPGELERARLDVVWLASQRPVTVPRGDWSNTTVIVMDRNRTTVSARAYEEWRQAVSAHELGRAEFGPMRLIFLGGRLE